MTDKYPARSDGNALDAPRVEHRPVPWDDRLLHVLTPQRLWALPIFWRCALAIGIVVVATVLRMALQPWMGTVVPYNIAMVAVVVSTVTLGIIPGLLTVALCDIAVEVFVLGSSPAMWTAVVLSRLGVSMAIGVFVVLILYAARAAAIRAGHHAARLATLAAATFEGIVESEAGRIVDCNEQFARMTGYSVAELRGMEVASLVAPEDRDRVMANIRQGRESQTEHIMLRKDGASIVVETHGRSVSPGGARRHTAVRDITVRKRVEADLLQAKEEWERTFDSVPDLIAIIDQEHRIVRVNRAMAQRLGRSPEQCAGGHCYEAVHGTDGPPAICPHSRTLADRQQHAAELHEDRLCGDFWVTTTPLQDQNGRTIGSVHVARDITERKRAEREHEITVELLRLINAAQGTRELVHAAVSFFHAQSGCEAVGVRLREGEDFPYMVSRGFPAEFVNLENSLCARDAAGRIVHDSAGNPLIECMCGNVICGRFDPAKPFFTAQGSFWTNCTTELLASTTDADRQTRTRNRCNGEGFESVALIPLRVGAERLGLLQLNDRRRGMFAADTIAAWERLAGYLAVALSKLRADDEVRRRVAELNTMNTELASFNRAMVDRELRMIELKKQVNELCVQAGQPPRYAVQSEPPRT